MFEKGRARSPVIRGGQVPPWQLPALASVQVDPEGAAEALSTRNRNLSGVFLVLFKGAPEKNKDISNH